MELLLLRIWIFVITFCFGISVSALWRIYTLPSLPIPVVDLTAAPSESLEQVQAPDPPGELRIVNEQHSCGASSAPLTYELTDGGRISTLCKTFKSQAAASRELKKRLSTATIVEQTFDEVSQGEEIIAIAPNAVRLWKAGRTLCTTEASSLRHLRWFQKRYSH